MNSSNLNAKQCKIVEHGDGVVIINAGPGTGKTKTLTSRVAYLLQNKKINPEKILILTFTQRAVLEMKERLQNLLSTSFPIPQVTTFHGFAFEKLTEYGKEIKIIPQLEQDEIIKKIANDLDKKISARGLSLMISLHKNTTGEVGNNLISLYNRFAKTPRSYREDVGEVRLHTSVADESRSGSKLIKKTVAFQATEVYNEQLSKLGFLDFDDLLLQLFNLLRADEQKRREFQEKYQYILIDEFQDTNNLQYQIIKLILNNNPNLFVIGDPLQSIYGFRGADAAIFDFIKKDFPDFKEETLVTNYRSNTSIVRVSNGIFPGVSKIEPFSKRDGVVQLVTVLDEYREAEWVVRFINKKMGGMDLLNASEDTVENISFSDFAVIYRTHGLARVLEKILDESGLPYQIVKEDSYLEGDHIKLLSMHAAKGLEFKYVFICGFEEGLIPHKNCDDLEEEKRLFYVAMTRAKEGLYLLYTKRRNKKEMNISQFRKLIDFPLLYEKEDEVTEKTLQKQKALRLKRSQMGLF